MQPWPAFDLPLTSRLSIKCVEAWQLSAPSLYFQGGTIGKKLNNYLMPF